MDEPLNAGLETVAEDMGTTIEDPEGSADGDEPSSPLAERSRRTPYSTGTFVPGDAASWAPWTIRSEVRALILESLPKPNDKGCIYVVQDLETQHVKIGMTVRPFRTRLSEISRDHKRKLDEKNAWHLPGIPYIQLLRLEALVHADLAYFQRNLQLSTRGARRTHREWFNVDMATAQRTVRLWRDVMRTIALEPGNELNGDIVDDLHSSPAFDVDMTSDGILDAQAWSQANTDHNQRIQMWTGLLLSKTGRRQTADSRRMTWWVAGCVVVWLLPDLLGLSTKVAFIASAVLLSIWTRYALL
jgi:hypothetical protein